MNGAPAAGDVRELIDRCLRAGIRLALDKGGEVHATWPDTPEGETLVAELRASREAVAALLKGLPRPGGHLVRLGLALGLRPRCRFTVREQGDHKAAQRFAQAVADLCRRHPGREVVLMVAVEPDGERVPVLWRAAVGPELRRALAELVRDYHLGLGRFGLWNGAESADGHVRTEAGVTDSAAPVPSGQEGRQAAAPLQGALPLGADADDLGRPKVSPPAGRSAHPWPKSRAFNIVIPAETTGCTQLRAAAAHDKLTAGECDDATTIRQRFGS